VTTLIPARPTEYGGVLYRSTTEARWAVFFDSLDMKYIYEPEWFVTHAGAYKPDFLLVGQSLIAEVKPSFDSDPAGVQKLRSLIAGRGMERGVILPAIQPGDVHLLLMGPDHGEVWEDDRGTWLTCPQGYHFDVQSVPEIGCKECPQEGNYWYESDRIRRAYTFARSYRFRR
jgi:hypothetical protein